MTMTNRLERAIHIYDDGLVRRLTFTVYQVGPHTVRLTVTNDDNDSDWLHCTCAWAHWRQEAAVPLAKDPCAHSLAAGLALSRGMKPPLWHRLSIHFRRGVKKQMQRLRELLEVEW